jgi:ATP-dependent DNA helicase RecQ
VLKITPAGRRVLKGEETPRLLKPAVVRKRAALPTASWEGVDRELFETLRELRRRQAQERSLPPFVVFSDATLRDLARRRPSSPQQFLKAHGIGEKKCAEYSTEFLAEIARHCREFQVEMDVAVANEERPSRVQALAAASGSAAKKQAFELFKQGKSIDEVQQRIGRARSTTTDYLCEHIELEGICDASFWLDEAVCSQVQQAAGEVGAERLKPIFEALNGTVPYDQIRIALACLRQAGKT